VIRIAHLSDIHFGDENGAAVAAAAERLRGAPPTLTVISGDITRWGERNEFAAAKAWIETLPAPVFVTPGNHDAPYIAWVERIFRPFARYERAFGAAPAQRFRAPGVSVWGVNTARGAQARLNWSKGQISQAQVEGVIGDVRAGDGVRIVVCHHPLLEMEGAPMTGRVWGGEAAARAFAGAGVDLVLTGHVHAPFVLAYAFGDGRTYAVGAGTLSSRERGAAAGFNEIDIEKAAIRVAALSWTGSHFEPSRTWSMDRR